MSFIFFRKSVIIIFFLEITWLKVDIFLSMAKLENLKFVKHGQVGELDLSHNDVI
jgi:hypothetical protein